jgi:hypothetical protein
MQRGRIVENSFVIDIPRSGQVQIEREDAETYRELRREFTTELFIEVSLLPGKYRF